MTKLSFLQQHFEKRALAALVERVREQKLQRDKTEAHQFTAHVRLSKGSQVDTHRGQGPLMSSELPA
jgi:hypothetical protein